MFSNNVIINKMELTVGIMLILLGMMMPYFLNVENMNIYTDLQMACSGEPQNIMFAAYKLVLLNGIRGFPHYLGVFLIVESVCLKRKGKEIRFIKTLMACSLIPLVYCIIEKIYLIRYDFGIPAILVITLLIILEKIDFNMINVGKKTLLVGMTFMTFQWLDVMPSLSGHAFGRGETSNDIKNIATLLGGDMLLQNTALLFFFLFLFSDLLLFKLILDENNLRTVSQENQRNQENLMASNMRVMENRTYIELNHLVHDLKSPLTSMQALIGVIKLGNRDEKETVYLDKIEASIERMSSMISEILYEKQKSPIMTIDIMNTILSQVSNSEYASFIQSDNRVPDLYITVNKIRFSRAIINLLENAYYALNHKKGKIYFNIDEIVIDDSLYALIKIEDNGTGISEEQMASIWEIGYSTRDSLGLGLGFVKKVIEDNHGLLDMESVEDYGTIVTICIPAEYEKNISNTQILLR